MGPSNAIQSKQSSEDSVIYNTPTWQVSCEGIPRVNLCFFLYVRKLKRCGFIFNPNLCKIMWPCPWAVVFQPGNGTFTAGIFCSWPLEKNSTGECPILCIHYDDVIMCAIASQITSLTIFYSTVYPGADQSKHQSSASLAFVWGIHRGPVNSPHRWPVTRKMFPFDDVIIEAQFAVGTMRKHQSFTLLAWWVTSQRTSNAESVPCYVILVLWITHRTSSKWNKPICQFALCGILPCVS